MAKANSKRGGISRSEVTARIFKLFVAPLMNDFVVNRHTTDNQLHAKLEMWFNKDSRDIWLARATGSFKIPGPRWLTDSTPERLHVHGMGDRHVKKGDYLWIRYDSHKPDTVDVEFKDQVFVVQTSDWKVYADRVEEIL